MLGCGMTQNLDFWGKRPTMTAMHFGVALSWPRSEPQGCTGVMNVQHRQSQVWQRKFAPVFHSAMSEPRVKLVGWLGSRIWSDGSRTFVGEEPVDCLL